MKRQRGYVQLIVYGVMALAAAGAMYAIYSKVMHWCNTACVEVTAERDALQAEKTAAQERATALALLWADGLNKVEVRYVEQVKVVERVFGELRDRARAVVGGGGIQLRADEQRVLLDAHRAANPDPDPAVAAVDHRPAEAVPAATGDTIITPAQYAQAYVEGAEAYRDAYDKWQAAVAAYNALSQELQP